MSKRGMSPNVPTLHSITGKTWAEATSQLALALGWVGGVLVHPPLLSTLLGSGQMSEETGCRLTGNFHYFIG